MSKQKISTKLTKTIETTSEKTMYDESCKKILSDKSILALIMKECITEYKNIETKEIIKHIEGNPVIGKTEFFTGKTIKGLTTEIIGNNNGKIFFDIRYRATVPSANDMVELIINIEAQNDQYPGYPLVKRGIFYDCMMITSQYGTEFDKLDYNKIKKVYSIWLCRNAPQKLSNSITAYEMNERNIIGNVKEKKENYDLLTVVMVHLGKAKSKQKSDLLNLLNRLFSEEIRAKEKLEILEKEYNISPNEDFEREVVQMCNWSKTVEDKGIAAGIEQGIEQGRVKERIEMARKLILKGMPLAEISELMEIPIEQLTS